ncbi:MAG TPA: magnesium transporter [bacterium]|nr:magnesium transporter [bacterium]
MQDNQADKNIQEIFEELLSSKRFQYLKTVLMDLHPADIAEALQKMDPENVMAVIRQMDTETAARVFLEIDPPFRKVLFQKLDDQTAVDLVLSMDSDDAADVIGELEPDKAEKILGGMPFEEFREVKTLLRHDEETAGGIMALEVVAMPETLSARDALKELRRQAEDLEDVYNIYAVDHSGVLKGVVSLKELVLASPKKSLNEFMDKEPVAIHTKMDQEEVANIFKKYDLASAPVVDEHNRLAGRITFDDIMDVAEEEASEDIALMAGITDEKIHGQSIWRISSVRLPWLMVAFIGEMVSALVMSRFHASLERVLAAAFFIPLMMAMGGNVGIQSATVVIRGLAVGDIGIKDTMPRLLREILGAMLNGLIIACILVTIVTFWQNEFRFGLVLGVSLILVIINAALFGTLVPFVLKMAGVDPAIATGPFITTSNDILGLMVYFGMVALFLPKVM